MTRILRPISPDDIQNGLKKLFGNSTDSQTDYYRVFLHAAQQESYDLSRQIIVQASNQLVFSCLYTPSAGLVSTIYAADPTLLSGHDRILAVRAMVQLRLWALKEGSVLLQSVLEPHDRARRELFLRSGYRQLTQLDYLYRLVDVPSSNNGYSSNQDNQWLTWSAERAELFAEVISQTYQNSMDCPELSTIRTLNETIDSHHHAGLFNPDLWYILTIQGHPAGVLLLTPSHNRESLEITYLGIVPAWRGHKLGEALMQQALNQAARLNKKLISLAVDNRNLPALQLYHKFHFKSLFSRLVMYYSSRWSIPKP